MVNHSKTQPFDLKTHNDDPKSELLRTGFWISTDNLFPVQFCLNGHLKAGLEIEHLWISELVFTMLLENWTPSFGWKVFEWLLFTISTFRSTFDKSTPGHILQLFDVEDVQICVTLLMTTLQLICRLICAVPLVLERIYKSILDTMQRKGWAAEELFDYFMQYKIKWQDRGFDTPLLNKTVFRVIRYFLGGRLRLMLSGGAPLSPDTHSLTR
jgi:hypothetical protein